MTAIPASIGATAPTYGGGGVYGGGELFGGQQQTLQLFDETGNNPLPAGIFVEVVETLNGSSVGSAWTQPGGLCAIALPPDVECTAIFSLSQQAPGVSVTFTPDGASSVYSVTVAPYRSPSLSAIGYALFEMSKLVRGWYSDAAKAPGGVAYAIGYAGAAGLADADDQTQINLQAMRLQSSLKGQIDSWSLDMVGPMFTRYPQESDQLFIARNELMVSRPRCTINAIQAFVEAFYASVLAGWSITGSESLADDVAGGNDVSGGLNVAPSPTIPKKVPPILVWDKMTQPQLAQVFSIGPPQFVIQIGNLTAKLNEMLAYGETGGLDISGALNIAPTQGTIYTPTSVAPDPRLGAMINLIAKAAGTVPMYLVGQL